MDTTLGEPQLHPAKGTVRGYAVYTAGTKVTDTGAGEHAHAGRWMGDRLHTDTATGSMSWRSGGRGAQRRRMSNSLRSPGRAAGRG